MITYYSLASGFLSGKYRSQDDLSLSPRGARVARYLDERGRRILAALDEVARRLGSSPASVALAWLMSRPAVVAPIASASGTGQLRELLAAVELILDAAALAKLDQASA